MIISSGLIAQLQRQLIQHARVLYARGLRRAGLAFDQSNLPFSGTWIEAFSKEFERLGGKTAGTAGFASVAETRFADVIRNLLQHEPDALIFVASTLDTSRLAQQARRLAELNSCLSGLHRVMP